MRSRKKGQVFIEVAAGGVILIATSLFLLDVATVVLVTIANDHLAKAAARAAANHRDQQASRSAALDVISRFPTSSVITGAKLTPVDGFRYEYPDSVTVGTTLEVKLPVPMPILPTSVTLTAQGREPILVAQASRPDNSDTRPGDPNGGVGDNGSTGEEDCNIDTESGSGSMDGGGNRNCKN